MSNSGIGRITTIILFITVLFIAVMVAKEMYAASTITDGSSDTLTEQDLDQITQEVIDEISTYIQINDQKGKYNNEQRIEKIALWISPLVSQEIDISQLTIQINNGEYVKILTYDGNVTPIGSNTIFEDPIWEKLNCNNFGFISIVDVDNSLINYNIINDYSDNAYLVFRLPDDMTMAKHDKMLVTLFPSTGITRTTILEAPLPIKSVVTFE